MVLPRSCLELSVSTGDQASIDESDDSAQALYVGLGVAAAVAVLLLLLLIIVLAVIIRRSVFHNFSL